ncbi:hypothetical protein RF11_03768 [Thelohanellus kitauei]|uniref:Uncharacterized protein n=1 Tax=Thelohanellus kitauei TaxID=669202 RepID=A0A0C2MI04_THEKT|nr:hypothetical protein RF11_03768 [Thelohanellus kitauei]
MTFDAVKVDNTSVSIKGTSNKTDLITIYIPYVIVQNQYFYIFFCTFDVNTRGKKLPFISGYYLHLKISTGEIFSARNKHAEFWFQSQNQYFKTSITIKSVSIQLTRKNKPYMKWKIIKKQSSQSITNQPVFTTYPHQIPIISDVFS